MAAMVTSSRRSVTTLLLTTSISCWASLPSPTPALPDVETVLSKARDKAYDFAEQARAMQARVEDEQAKSRSTLNATKQEYEKKLNAQARENEKLDQDNTDLTHDIQELSGRNLQLQQESSTFATANKAMRGELDSLLVKVRAAESFMQDSLEQTDDSQAPELLVLEPTTQKPTLDHFLKVAQGGSEVALLQIESERKMVRGQQDKKPQELVTILSSSLEAIGSAEKEGAAQMKASFMENFAVGQKRKEELATLQAALIAEKNEATNTQQQLLVAKEHVKDTFLQLGKRLHGMRIFSRKIDSMAASAIKEAFVPQKVLETSLALPKATVHTMQAANATTVKPVSVLRHVREEAAYVAVAPAASAASKANASGNASVNASSEGSFKEKARREVSHHNATGTVANATGVAKANSSVKSVVVAKPAVKQEAKGALARPVADKHAANKAPPAMLKTAKQEASKVSAKPSSVALRGVATAKKAPAKAAPVAKADHGSKPQAKKVKAEVSKKSVAAAVRPGSPQRTNVAFVQTDTSSQMEDTSALPKGWPVFGFLKWR